MTTVLKEIVGELSGLSGEKQLVAAPVIHALWAEEQASESVADGSVFVLLRRDKWGQPFLA